MIEFLLREAFGESVDFALSDQDIEIFRGSFGLISPYFIMFTARSGSSFLSEELASTSVLSTPYEWFNYDDVAETIRRTEMTFSEYVKDIISIHQSESGTFGCKINWLQLVALNAIISIDRLFPRRIRWFLLRRLNLVAQGVSNFIAAKSNIYHYDKIPESGLNSINEIGYDATKIKEAIKEILNQEIKIEAWLRSNHVDPVRVFYEDVVEDPKRISMLFANVMNVRLPQEYLLQTNANKSRKISTEKNLYFEEKFRSEELDFLREIMDLRPLVLSPSRSI